MTISAVFKSTLQSFNYFYKNGMSAVFIGGRYTTNNEKLAREMFEEVGAIGKTKSNHPYIFVDEDESEIDSEALSPLEVIKLQAKEEARKELLAEQAAATSRALNKDVNISKSNSGDFAKSVGNSDTIAQQGAADSTGEGVGIGTTDPAAVATSAPAATASSMSARLAALNISKP